jgi:hypothetical protein
MGSFRKAERKKAKLRLGIVGPSGSGKTFSALLLAKGLGGKVAVIDTENGSAELYADEKKIGLEYDVCVMSPPYSPQKYIQTIHEAEQGGYDVVIIDSLSHAWAGQGGILEQVDARKGRGNDFTAWRDLTPWHNKLIDAMLQSPCHIIATMRSKVAYELQKNEKGKLAPVKVGLAPIQREGMDYEFTVVLDVDQDRHMAQASKDRTSLFDGQVFQISEQTGAILKDWLASGADAPVPIDNKRINRIWHGYQHVCGQDNHAVNAIKAIVGDKGKAEWTDADMVTLETDLAKRVAEVAKDGTSLRPEVEAAQEREPGQEG